MVFMPLNEFADLLRQAVFRGGIVSQLDIDKLIFADCFKDFFKQWNFRVDKLRVKSRPRIQLADRFQRE